MLDPIATKCTSGAFYYVSHPQFLSMSTSLDLSIAKKNMGKLRL
jgi:hypothetical protein